ncbi:hypothetical protein ScPMuIL_016834 [Solemya velum]
MAFIAGVERFVLMTFIAGVGRGVLMVLIAGVGRGKGEACQRWRAPTGTLVRGVRLDRFFVSIPGITMVGCARQCFVRTSCRSFNYNLDSNTCELNSISLNDTSGTASEHYVYSDITGWPREVMPGNCSRVTCPEQHMCVARANGLQSCHRTECVEPPEVPHASIESSLRCVGCTVAYGCIEGYRTADSATSANIECLHNGQWTTSTYQCQEYYLGCYIDSGTRDLNGASVNLAANTPQLCTNYCFDQGFAYAGVQYGSQCFCGNEYGTHGPSPESTCNMACPGDPDVKCGSSWKSNIYATGVLQT